MLINSNRVDDVNTVNTVIPYRFTFMDSKERATNSISEQCNPTFNFATHIPIPTVTAHHLKYFEDGALQIDVWAKRIPVNTTQTERLSTTELINKFRIDGGNRGKEALRRRSKAVAILPFGMMRSGLGGGEGGSSTLGNRKGDDNSEGAIGAAGAGAAGAGAAGSPSPPSPGRPGSPAAHASYSILSAQNAAEVQNLKLESKLQKTRLVRAAAKLARIKKVLKKAQDCNIEGVAVSALTDALHPKKGARKFRGLARTVILMNRARKWTSAIGVAAAAAAAPDTRSEMKEVDASADSTKVTTPANGGEESDSKACHVM